MKSKYSGDLFALTCAISTGLANIPEKIALDNVSAEILNFYLFVFAGILSAVSLFNTEKRREILSPEPKILSLIFFLSISYAFALTFGMSGLKIIQPATASFLSRFEIIFTIALAYMLLKERLTPVETLGGVIAVAGLFIFKYRTNMIISEGASFMVLSALFFAISEVIVKRNIGRLGTASFLFYRNLFLVPILLAILLFRKQTLYLPDYKILLLTASGALLGPIIGRATYQMALKRIDISRAALITQSTPLFTALFALVIIQSLPSPIEWLGGLLIVGGVIVVKLSQRS